MTDVTAIGLNKIITVKSSDRSYGTPSNFSINLASYNLNPTYCSWHQIALPNGYYNVNYNSNNLSVTVYDASNTPYVVPVSVPVGNYASSGTNSIITAVTNQLNPAISTATGGTSTGSFFTGTLSTLTGYFNLSTSVSGWSFTVNTSLGSLDWILGYRNTQSITKVTSATGAAILDLRSYPNVYIRSSLVSGNSISAKGSDSFLAVVQNTALFSQTIFQRSPESNIDLFPVSGQLSNVTFQLVDEHGLELPMDTNQDWEMSICLYTKQ